MKIYLIYKRTEGLMPFLYAYTHKKYLKELFEEERDMSLFSITKKDIEKDEYAKFKKEHSSLELGRRGFYTKSDDDSLSGKEVVYITATSSEEMDVYVKTDKVFLELGRFIVHEAEIMNDDIKEALMILYYFDVMRFNSELEMLHFDPHPIQNFNVDELAVFLYLFGNTLKR